MYRKLGRIHEARASLEQFLAAAPADHPMRESVRALLDELPQDSPATAKPEAAPPIATATPSAETMSPAPRRRAWFRDPLAGALMATGVAAVGVGGGLLAWSGYQLSHSHDSYDAYLAARGAPNVRIAGAVLLSAGALVVAGAITRYLVARRRQRGR